MERTGNLGKTRTAITRMAADGNGVSGQCYGNSSGMQETGMSGSAGAEGDDPCNGCFGAAENACQRCEKKKVNTNVTGRSADDLRERLNFYQKIYLRRIRIMTIQELMEKRATVWEAAKNFVDTHENENGVLSAEDSATYERMEAEIEDLTKAIDRHRKAEEMEKNLNQPVKPAADGKPYAGGPGEPKIGRASDEYRRAMLNALRSNFRQVSNTLQEGVDADGGYLVPEEYDRRLVDVLNEENIMRRLATRIVTSGSTRSILQLPSRRQAGSRKAGR